MVVPLRSPALLVLRILAIAAILLGVSGRVPVTARAASPADTPPPGALALPASAYPAGSLIQGGAVTDGGTNAGTGIHTHSLASLGRTEGYRQTAWWHPGGKRGKVMQLRYAASLFSGIDGAAAAAADARATLWEIGRPSTKVVLGGPCFLVTERDGHQDAYLILYHGAIEYEVRLRVASHTPGAVLATAFRSLGYTAWRAWQETAHLVPNIPPATVPTASIPPLFVAPWGTGPIVKSPSLLALDSTTPRPHTATLPGAFRPLGLPAPALTAVKHAALITGTGLSRYAVEATTGKSGAWYQATSLYATTTLALAAMDSVFSSNRAAHFHRYPLDPTTWRAGWLAKADDMHAWTGNGEIEIAVRFGNLLMLLATFNTPVDSLVESMNVLAGSVPTWLHAHGTDIVDATGQMVHLDTVNWYGSEQQDFVAGGLDYRSYPDILWMMKRLGFSCLRLPFSNQLVEQNPIVSAHLAANPDLQGLHAMDILDRIISYAGALGISVILDNHRSDAGWSAEENGLWYTQTYPDSSFVHDWAVMAQHYAVNNVVVGADLRNEPHGPATWGDGNPATDWLSAAERAGNAALAVNPHLLILVEGVQHYGASPGYWWGGNLMGVATTPVSLHLASGADAHRQLVYSVHDYGPDNCGIGCPWFNTTTSYDSLTAVWEQYWGFITDHAGAPYSAPVMVGEFGTCNFRANCVSDTTPGSQGEWFSSLLRYIVGKHLNWAYWSLNGTMSTAGGRVYGQLDWYGLLDQGWTTPVSWIQQALQGIQSGTTQGAAKRV